MESKPIKIEPVSFRSGPPSPREKPFNILKWLAGVFLGIVLIVLGASAWFVFTARQVVITIAPVPETLAFSGSIPAPRIGNHYLMRTGEYTLTAVKDCFFPLEHTFRVSAEKRQKLHLKMEKLPGRLMIQAHQSGVTQSNIVGAQVYIDGHEVGKTPLESIEIKPGPAKLEIRASNYQDLNTEIQVHGCGKLQEFNMALIPGWSDVTVSSVPQGAILKIDGKSFGNTPSRIQLAAGTYLMEISADLYKTWTHPLIVKPNEPLEIKDIRLQPADGKLAIQTTPVEANVMIDGTFIGQTPLVIDLSPDKNHMIRISKAGYEKATRNVNVASATSTRLHVNLKPREGIINLWLKTADTELLVNGKSLGATPKQLRLIAVEHTLEFRKKGYRSYRTRITPRVPIVSDPYHAPGRVPPRIENIPDKRKCFQKSHIHDDHHPNRLPAEVNPTQDLYHGIFTQRTGTQIQRDPEEGQTDTAVLHGDSRSDKQSVQGIYGPAPFGNVQIQTSEP
ncbi:MAG: PEGA domain-containing protein [Deltaproteobacteria bacterium]|nr:PEGA domain-containing protein [Deltaproteobacteria bacterium]